MIPETQAGLDHSAPATPAQSLSFIYRRHAVRSYQPLLVVVQDSAVLAKLSSRAKALAKTSAADHGNLLKPPGASGDGIQSVLADPEFDIFYDATTLIAICAEMRRRSSWRPTAGSRRRISCSPRLQAASAPA